MGTGEKLPPLPSGPPDLCPPSRNAEKVHDYFVDMKMHKGRGDEFQDWD